VGSVYSVVVTPSIAVHNSLFSIDRMGGKLCKEPQKKIKVPPAPAPTPSRRNSVGSVDHDPNTFRAQYSAGAVLGTGGFAIVRRCTKRSTGEVFAVKIVNKDKLDESSEQSLRDEVRILKMLDCPYIIKIYDFFEEEHFFFLIEEFVEGGELFDRIAKKTVYNEYEARELVLVLLTAVKYCHDRDIVHRDLKPENLLMAHKGEDAGIKLADFGLATLVKGQELVQDCGTLDYCAPEILNRNHYGKAVDLWSVGVITFILLAGHPPFFDPDDAIVAQKIKRCDYCFDDEDWHHVSEEAKHLIKCLLQVNPVERYNVDQALNHKWMLQDSEILKARCLHKTLKKIKLTKNQKFRACVKVIIMINRMKHLSAEHHPLLDKAKAIGSIQ
jgi:calcium/calmodulin-dependent protein kinase I